MDALTDFTDLLTKTELQSVVDTPFCDCMCSGVARTSPLLGHSMGTLRGTFVRTSTRSAEAYRGVWGHSPPGILQPPRSVLRPYTVTSEV